MNKSTLNLIAKSIKSLDESLWSLNRGSDEYNTVSNARQNLVKIIFQNGYELKRDTYRLVKSKELNCAYCGEVYTVLQSDSDCPSKFCSAGHEESFYSENEH